MTGPESLSFTVGRGDWVREARSFTDQFAPGFWDDLSPCRAEEIEACERQIHRKLPDDFREFLLRIGAGNFGDRGDIYTPEEIILACSGPLLAVLGSSKWATREEHLRFFASRGAYNPRPDKFTREALVRDGVNLLDLVQIGTDGQCNYHQLNVAESPRPFGYCLLASTDLEDRLPSFSDGLKRILTLAWRSAHGLDEPTGPRLDISGIIFEFED